MTTGRTDLLLVYVPKQLHDGTARQGEYQGGQGNDGWLDLEKDIISSYQQKIVATIPSAGTGSISVFSPN
jgi:hypothetical protein